MELPSGSVQGPVACCEHSKEISGFIKDKNLLGELANCYILKNNSAN